MKRLFLAVAAIIMAVPAFAQSNMQMESTVYDFGRIAENGGKASLAVNFTNTGDQPLVIMKTRVSCSCTDVSFSKKPVLPGQKGTITITYDPKKQSGTFNKEVLVTSNIPETNKVITIKGSVY